MSCALHMDATAELCRRSEAYHTHFIAILFAEKCNSSILFGFLNRGVTVLFERQILTYHLVNDAFNLTQFLIGNLFKAVEIKAQHVLIYIRSALLCLLAEHLFQRIVEEMSGCMVAGRALSLVCINHSLEGRSGVLRHLLEDMDALIVLTLGVNNL